MMENLIYKWIITGVPPFSETSILQKMKLHRWTWRESGSITQQEFKIGTFCVTGVAWSDSLYSTMTTVGPSIFKMLIPHILPTNDWYRKDLTFGMKARKKGTPNGWWLGTFMMDPTSYHMDPYGSVPRMEITIKFHDLLIYHHLPYQTCHKGQEIPCSKHTQMILNCTYFPF